MMVYPALVLQQIIASSTHVVAKNITYDLSPAVLLFFRAGIAAFIYLVWLAVRWKKVKRLEKKDILTLLILGILNVPVNQLLFFTSVHMTTAPNVALAYALSPAFVYVIAAIFLKEKSSFLKLSGIFLAFAGTFLIIFNRGFDLSSEYFLGNILILIASFSWALYTVIGRNISRKYGAVNSTAMSMIIGYILYLPIFLILPQQVDLSIIEPVHWVQLVYLGLFTSVVGYALWYFGLTKIDAGRVAVFNNVQPVLTTILSMIFLSYTISIEFVIGGVLIITGVIITQRL
ncbi:MAG: DMT family transporter [Candidatus Kapaibacterium sp.]